MPTTLNRTHLTHTPPIQRALDQAAARWPGAGSSTVLLTRIAEDWSVRVARDEEAARDSRRSARQSLAGSEPGVYPADHTDRLRDEWPE